MTEGSNTQLKTIVSRIEKLQEDKDAIMSDIKEVYGEAKAIGYEVRAIRFLVRQRRKEAQKRKEESLLIETYAAALDEQLEMGF